MPFVNRTLLKTIPQEQLYSLRYRPDIYFYRDDANEYQTELRRLAEAKYLYTNGHDLKPVSVFRYVFETFKGWLGFNNHCEPYTVQLGLYKYAYYGYVQGYSLKNLNDLRHFGLDQTFISQITSPRNDDNTKQIQDRLTAFYVKNVQHLREASYQQISYNHAFGRSWTEVGLWSEIPKVDPQNETLIAETIKEIFYLKPTVNYVVYQSSKYAFTLARQNIQEAKARMEANYLVQAINYVFSTTDSETLAKEALELAPAIAMQEKRFFIEYYLRKKELSNAFALIDVYENVEEARDFLLNNFSQKQMLEYVKKDSPLAVALAHYYFDEDLETIRFVASIYTELKITFPAQAFRLLIADKKYEEAYQLFKEKREDVSFNKSDLILLANHYTSLSDTKYKDALALIKERKWDEANQLCLESMELMKKATELDSSADKLEKFYTRKRHYAQLIIDIDIDKHDIADCEIVEITKAINLLSQCDPKNKQEKKMLSLAIAKGRMRQIDHLVYTISPSSYDAEYKLKEHNEKHTDTIRTTINLLNQLVESLAGTDDKELKLILGKAYFLLGDINFFFFSSGYHDHFKAAMKTVPDNPFYVLRCSEVFEAKRNKLQEKGIPLLKKLGYETMHFLRWDEERWHKDKNPAATPIKDIHFPQKVKQENSSVWNLLWKS
ncbi:Uncharacterised protein [Legionella lansingensis]|uniref:Uncharacterized protein n=1 Tax=Legionella lansingensis TaxID=45067 RepID=A0A0W0VWG6_9GAMM|nr:hypothetical protein [Legionella lansingensis]KTD24360.1 hypothetical protein Llan_0499 [Legionella lansingensis]SNV51676.1 Uncharacterised protein [Legionella lansingensis]